MELQPGEFVDRYVVEEVLGRGGMATVYRVRHRELGGVFALKVLQIPSASVRDRLQAEGSFQATLRHPNVVAVLDVVTHEGSPALVLEFVDGPTLEALLRVHRPSVAQLDELADGILLGVRAAHRHGLVHRDLKPANILLQRTDDGFVPRITDFGLAKAVSGDAAGLHQTRTGAVLGTPAYMAPEQFGSSGLDARADLWALGLTLYELCTGQRPWEAQDLFELADRVRSGTFALPTTLVPDLPPRMEHAIVGALKVSPAERWDSVDAMRAAWRGMAEVADDRPSAWDRALLDSMSRSGSVSNRPPSTGEGSGRGAPRSSVGTWVDSAASMPSSEAPRPRPTVARRFAPFVAVAGLSLVVMLGVGVVGGGTLTLLSQTRSGPPAAERSEPSPVRAPRASPAAEAPAAAPEAPPEPAPKPPAESERRVEPASPPPPPGASPGPVGHSSASPPPPPAGTWSVKGDARSFTLTGPGGAVVLPTQSPPDGDYVLEATFADGGTARLEIHWSAGSPRTFRCLASTRSCVALP